MKRNKYVLYCDESTKKGRYYSNFYGGIIVAEHMKAEVERVLSNLCVENNLNSELKWTKVTENYLEKYIIFIDELFVLIKRNDIKIRVMFTQNAYEASNLQSYHDENRYFLLYYQFIKHAFGLQYAKPADESEFRLTTFLDELPEKHDRCSQFKEYLNSLERFPPFRRIGWKIPLDLIRDVNSKDHILLQALDIILGAMQFRLNDLHKEKPEGSPRRGKRTIAKEKLYKHINKRIREIYPNFNIGSSTGKPNGLSDKWEMPYRHWKFIPAEYEFKPERTKK